MKTVLCIALWLVGASFAYAERTKAVPRPDLKTFTSDQLKDCLERFRSSNVCGTHDDQAITAELVSRLPQMTTEKLVSCFANWKVCGTGESQASGWPISDEIAHRGNPHHLLLRYWSEPDRSIRDGIVDVAYHFKTREVAEFMRKVLIESKGDEQELYWPANYLAKLCDPAGLEWLSTREGRSQSCVVFESTVPLFRKCDYRPAIPYIVDYSIRDACLNIDDEGVKDLQHFFPHSRKSFDSMEDMQKYYCARAKRGGFEVTCDSK
jgi:hypothetical protein